MKVFIIHASAGHGHKMVAEAIHNLAIERYRPEKVRILDILDFTSSSFKTAYSKGYIFCISRLKWLWAIFFFLSDTKYLRLINYNLRRFTNKLFCRRFLNFLRAENPDVIISTHFLVNELVSFLKQEGSIQTKLISMVTDFGVHNFWVAKNVEKYACACQRTKEILLSKGIASEKIRVIGIPIRKQFQRTIDVQAVRKRLNFKSDGFTALILTGGIGMGPIEEIVKLLEDKIKVVAICGNNQKLYNGLKGLNYQNLAILGWVDYVEEIMSVCDLVVTKPGGSTISECLVKELPMIFFSIVPGQEYHNAKIISDQELGLMIEEPKKIAKKVLSFKDNPSELKAVKDKIRLFKQGNSAARLLDLINE